jgi:2-methylisocitrate lyase-like PEP mutase family enzyme
MPFLSLARELAALLLPIQPAQQFRDDLEHSLVAAAHQQNARAALNGYDPYGAISIEREGFERRWMIGAAAAAAVGSAVSIAGIMAYVWRRRSDRAA